MSKKKKKNFFLKKKKKARFNKQQTQSKLAMSKRRLNDINDENKTKKILLANGSLYKFKIKDEDDKYGDDDSSDDDNGKRRKKTSGLKFDKPFKPGKQQTGIFMWGKARPPRLFPNHTNQTTPFQHKQLSEKRLIYITAAKDGSHALGFSDNHWTFVWGESTYTGSLGLGNKAKSTEPFILKPLKRIKVIQVACSSRHGLAVTLERKVFGWGAKSLTNLTADTLKPTPLKFLNNLGCVGIDCSRTHSAAWVGSNMDVFMWGLPGTWLGFSDAVDKKRNFGRVEFGSSFKKSSIVSKVICGPQFTFYLLSSGIVLATGDNEHGRMGIGKDYDETVEPLPVVGLKMIQEISAGSFHSGFIDLKGKVYTCGVGKDFRLGHGNEKTVFEPMQVKAVADAKIVRIECVHDHTFVISKQGCVMMWGHEPVTTMVHSLPFIYEYMRHYRIYQVVGTKDFTIALGVHSKTPVARPKVKSGGGDVRMMKSYQQVNQDIADVVSHTSAASGGMKVQNVVGGFVQMGKVEKN